jgi:hypothetical protein
VYERPPLDVEIAALRSELARTSLQRPGERRRIEEKLRSLCIARDVAAEHYGTTCGGPQAHEPHDCPIEGRSHLLKVPSSSSSGGAAACRPLQVPDAGSGLSDGGSPSQPRGDQRGLETGRTSSRVA